MRHELKTWPEYYEEVEQGRKQFEIRFDDRGYLREDILHLKEWEQDTQTYTGRELRVRVTYLTNFGMRPGWICMSIKKVKEL